MAITASDARRRLFPLIEQVSTDAALRSGRGEVHDLDRT